MANFPGGRGEWNIDMSRFARESTDPVTYLASSYYQTWMRGLEKLLLEKGHLRPGELEARMAELAAESR